MKRIINFLKGLEYSNVAFLVGTPIIAIGGVAYLIKTNQIHPATLGLGLFMTIITGLAITAGYHRLFSHKSYEANWLFKLVMLVFGAAAFENSAIRWASDHRRHHRFVDTNQDPYNIKRGFWYAHMGWVMLKYDKGHNYDNVPDLEEDKLVAWQDKYYAWIGIVAGFIFPTVLASLWGDPLGGFLVPGVARTVMNHHFTFSINSFAHLIGKRPYSEQNSSRDNWFLAFLTYGEGYHNYHHKFPTDYRNGIRAYHWDPTKWLVNAMAKWGVTYNLRRVPAETILRARLKIDEKRLIRQLHKAPSRINHEFVVNTRLKIESAYAHFRDLKQEYQRLQKEKLTALSEHLIEAINARIQALKAEIEKARERLKLAISEWMELCSTFGVRSRRFLIA